MVNLKTERNKLGAQEESGFDDTNTQNEYKCQGMFLVTLVCLVCVCRMVYVENPPPEMAFLLGIS